MMQTWRIKRLALRRPYMILVLMLVMLLVSHTMLHMEFKKTSPPVFLRNSHPASVFHHISQEKIRVSAQVSDWKAGLAKFVHLSLDASQNERRVLAEWDSSKSSAAAKCRHLISTLYKVNPDWSNDKIVEYHANDEVDNVLFSLLGERLRIYDYCFMKNNLNPAEVFSGTTLQYKDYQNRMFPFLKTDLSIVESQPIITNLQTGKLESLSLESLPNGYQNATFWESWSRLSNGKGIAITMGEKDKPIFIKQLKVLEHLHNKLPIQLITNGNELSSEFITTLAKEVQKTTQQVYLVDCTPLLAEEFATANIKNFLHKWLAVIFNTFEELIFLDIDVIPFIDFEYFLGNADYQSTGLLLYKDREMPGERTFQYCIDMLHDLEPSIQENELIGSRMAYYIDGPNPLDSEEALVYENFFKKMHLHHVDSGLMVINKDRKINGLLFSFMTHLDAKMRRCVYGDKEIFWLGQLFAGEEYTIDSMQGSIIGPLMESVNELEDKVSYHICASQIAHADTNQHLLWTNGGLRTCKIANSAETDFKKDPDYFTERYNNVEALKGIYEAPLVIEGMITPQVDKNSWMQIKECSGYIYCAFAILNKGEQDVSEGLIKKFDDNTRAKFNRISHIWNTS